MSTAALPETGVALGLRRLYFVRFAFALLWAGSLVATASSLSAVSLALLVLYPVFDVAAAIVDLRSSKETKAVTGLYVNIAISLLAATGLVLAASSGIPGVLRVWGSWAIVSGLVQLVVGVLRRGLGGQWPMILSGGISVLAGTSFILQSAKDGATLVNLAGYALLGGIFFLVSALRLRAKSTSAR
ncbi:membrane protein [Lentzea roselyniae]|uniref:Membrane protein n=1 Tax=Lentzea roselyniae TaxID=531940 RepID=A0ABP7B4R5_9PSEU